MKAFRSTSALFLCSMTALASANSDEDPTCMGFRLDLPGLPMEKVLPRDQGRLASGPGYAATAALDAWRFSPAPRCAPLKETLDGLLNAGCMDLERDGDRRRTLSDDLAPFIDAEEARRVAARRKRDTGSTSKDFGPRRESTNAEGSPQLGGFGVVSLSHSFKDSKSSPQVRNGARIPPLA